MKLTGRSISNTVSDARYEWAAREMQMRQLEEYEQVHDGSGRSEEMPSDLSRLHANEWAQLKKDRDSLGIMEWVRLYGSTSP